MATYREAKCRLCRREGGKLFLKGDKCYNGKCPFEKRPTPPGAHGLGRKRFPNTASSCVKSRRLIVFTAYRKVSSALAMKKPTE